MAKVKNISGVDRTVPWAGRLVIAGGVIEVPDEQLESYTCQPGIWQEAEAKKAAKAAPKEE